MAAGFEGADRVGQAQGRDRTSRDALAKGWRALREQAPDVLRARLHWLGTLLGFSLLVVVLAWSHLDQIAGRAHAYATSPVCRGARQPTDTSCRWQANVQIVGTGSETDRKDPVYYLGLSGPDDAAGTAYFRHDAGAVAVARVGDSAVAEVWRGTIMSVSIDDQTSHTGAVPSLRVPPAIAALAVSGLAAILSLLWLVATATGLTRRGGFARAMLLLLVLATFADFAVLWVVAGVAVVIGVIPLCVVLAGFALRRSTMTRTPKRP
jgi:hypothetical protein